MVTEENISYPEWLGKIKPGDEVAVKLGMAYRIGVVTRVTPSGQVLVDDHEPKFRQGYRKVYGDQFERLYRLTDSLRETIIREEAIRVIDHVDLETLPTDALQKMAELVKAPEMIR